MSRSQRQRVAERAQHRCEYCRYPENASLIAHQLDHIIPRQHGGGDELGNLALACALCNRSKGPNLASLDSETDGVVPLYNPRMQDWSAHFQLEAECIIGLTSTGRATAALLHFNDEARMLERRLLIQSGYDL